MRVAGRLMQLERLEHAATDEHFQGNQASLPIDLVELVRHYEQVYLRVSSSKKWSDLFFQRLELFQKRNRRHPTRATVHSPSFR